MRQIRLPNFTRNLHPAPATLLFILATGFGALGYNAFAAKEPAPAAKTIQQSQMAEEYPTYRIYKSDRAAPQDVSQYLESLDDYESELTQAEIDQKLSEPPVIMLANL